MSIKCIEVIKLMETIAPQHLACSWDNVGLIVGEENADITNVLVALDVTEKVIDEAVYLGANLIISHHPCIFSPIKSIINTSNNGSIILKAIKNNINLFAAHTNLDIVDDGVNDVLASKLSLKKVTKLNISMDNFKTFDQCARIGCPNQSFNLKQFASHVKKSLNQEGLTFVGSESKLINKVAISGGSTASSSIFTQIKDSGADVYITSDVKYHDAQFANAIGLAIIDATHYATELPIISHLANKLNNQIDQNHKVKFYESQINGQVFNFI